MAAEGQWYDVINGPRLSQGDILFQLHIPKVTGITSYPIKPTDEVSVDVIKADVIIVSQSCDLEHNNIEDVVVAEVIEWSVARDQLVSAGNQKAKGKDYRRALVAGNFPSLSLLHKHNSKPELPWSVVDFHRIYVVSKILVTYAAEHAGDRLRLKPPYKEHLAQAYARYFMRVGLPHDAKSFIDEG